MAKKCKRILAYVLIPLVFSTFYGCGLFPKEEETLAPPLVEPEEITYITQRVKIDYIENPVKCTGYLVPVNSENHFFKEKSGRLKKINVLTGDMVKKGDVLAELLTDTLETDIRFQELDVESRLRAHDYAKRSAELDMQLAKRKVEQLEGNYKLMLNAPQIYTKKEVENTLLDLNDQKALYEKLALDCENQITVKEIELSTAKMRLENLKKELERSRLKALMDGVVTYVSSVQEGEYVDTYSTIIIVSDPKDLHIEYQGRDASYFKLGMEVEVKIDDVVGSGKVVMTPLSVPHEEYEKYRETIRIKLDELPENASKGDRAEIKLILESSENAMQIPQSAVRFYKGEDVVYVLEEGLKIEKYVETGIKSANMVEIVSGLNPEDMVIIE